MLQVDARHDVACCNQQQRVARLNQPEQMRLFVVEFDLALHVELACLEPREVADRNQHVGRGRDLDARSARRRDDRRERVPP